MPLQTGILSMFARSPMRPLQKHMEKAQACVELLLPFYKAIIEEDWNQAESVRTKITTLENEADDLKMDLRLHLPKNLLLPVPRMDLLDLLAKQELIANITKDISGIMLGRKMSIPDSLQDHFKQYLTRSIDASAKANKAINELDELLESGFRGKEVELVNNMTQELNVIERDTDKMQIALRDKLFAIEDSLGPVDVIFLYKIIEWIGALADSAQQVGNRLRMLSAQ